MIKVPFYKMSGSGNDFILIDNRKGILSGMDMESFASRICVHRMSVGGDGLIFIEESKVADFKCTLHNADGSRADMSGNGSRCTARFAFLLGIVKKDMTFETGAGVLRAEVEGYLVKVSFPPPKDLRLNIDIDIDGERYDGHFINTGVPHLVYLVNDVERLDLIKIGRATRRHNIFSPAGTNVNFIKLVSGNTLQIRTYERGVEDETLACGTGSVASAIIASILKGVSSPVILKTRSGKELIVHFKRDGKLFFDILLEGDAMVIYEGEMWEEAWM
ncbi:MAG TPA: diaminopimelate epimerase [Nitrospiria bacterium]|nr:diaminopimelate epimerase [Nitrospiria bacterium]